MAARDYAVVHALLDAKIAEVQQATGKRTAYQDRVATMVTTTARARAQVDLLQQGRLFLQYISEAARRRVFGLLDATVSSAMGSILQTEDTFTTDVTGTRKSVRTSFKVVTPEGRELNPIEEDGGGLVDVITTTLRLAVSQIAVPAIPGPILMDEPMNQVSEEFLLRAAEMLKALSVRFNRQFIIVTHEPLLAAHADRVFRVSKPGASSVVVQER